MQDNTYLVGYLLVYNGRSHVDSNALAVLKAYQDLAPAPPEVSICLNTYYNAAYQL